MYFVRVRYFIIRTNSLDSLAYIRFKRNMKKFALILLLAVAMLPVFAQARIEISESSIQLSRDSLCIDSTFNMQFYLRSTGLSDFTDDTIRIICNFPLSTNDPVASIYHPADIPAGDSDLIVVNNIEANAFRVNPGNNIIVIWPKAFSSSTGDSAQFALYVEDCAALGLHAHGENKILFFYDAAGKEIGWLNNELQLTRLAVYNSSGQKMSDITHDRINKVNADWPPGMYLIRYSFDNRHFFTQKIIIH